MRHGRWKSGGYYNVVHLEGMELQEILQIAVRGGASDIHLKPGLPPMFRHNGGLHALKDAAHLTADDVERLAFGIMSDVQREKFERSNEIDLGYGVPGLGRFRVNVFRQRGSVGIVVRVIPFKVPSLKELQLPAEVEKIALEQRGLVLVTGTTGSGKSTSLAAMVDIINTKETCHIITIEDPIEFLIRDKASIVSQREVGQDTASFGQALKSALRQDPDVILVGEMRDMETIETALVAAATGHLVMSTLHTSDATETVNRISAVFPPHQQKQIRLQLASVLRAVISQRLVPRADGKGRVPAVEILKVTARVRELIEDKDRTREIPEAIAQGYVSYGMQTFDQSLMALCKGGLINVQEALRQASNPDDFALRLKGVSSGTDGSWDNFEGKKPPVSAARPAVPAPRVSAPKTPLPTPQVASKPQSDEDFKIDRY